MKRLRHVAAIPVAVAVIIGCGAAWAGELSATEDAGPPPSLVVTARILESTPTPTLMEIAPYDSALVVHTYRVVNVESGELDDAKIAVAHWAILDRRSLDIPADPGKLFRLTLKPFQACPELRGRKVVDATGGFDLLFFIALESRAVQTSAGTAQTMSRP